MVQKLPPPPPPDPFPHGLLGLQVTTCSPPHGGSSLLPDSGKFHSGAQNSKAAEFFFFLAEEVDSDTAIKFHKGSRKVADKYFLQLNKEIFHIYKNLTKKSVFTLILTQKSRNFFWRNGGRVSLRPGNHAPHRSRIKTEEKAKVVAAAWGAEFINSLLR